MPPAEVDRETCDYMSTNRPHNQYLWLMAQKKNSEQSRGKMSTEIKMTHADTCTQTGAVWIQKKKKKH